MTDQTLIEELEALRMEPDCGDYEPIMAGHRPYVNSTVTKAIELVKKHQQREISDNCTSDALIRVLKMLHSWVTQEPSQPSDPAAQQWVKHHIEEALSFAHLQKRESEKLPAHPDRGLPMSAIKVGMKLKSTVPSSMPAITVTEITPKGFKYIHERFFWRPGEWSESGESYGIDGYSFYNEIEVQEGK